MAQNIQRRKGAGVAFTGNVGDVSNAGPVVGIVKNNVDPTRSGRLQVCTSKSLVVMILQILCTGEQCST